MYVSFAQFNKEKNPDKYAEILAHPNLDKVVIDSIQLGEFSFSLKLI